MTRSEIKISLSTLATGVVLLSALWGYLMSSTLYARPGVGKAPYNSAADPKKAQP